ncbi:MAG: type III-A CRISPR-associated RAMP protein Csm5, partial [Chlorobiaceae bacterium]|nr:type III-A CRISPR-associated RAMP protein Csm5 [Chlorobiaceae bacterium]
MKQTLRSHKVRLTTLSPLFIGAGEEHTLSPYSDYVQRGDSLIYIDTDKLQEAMQGNKALVDAFVNGIRQFDNNRSTFELETFITETLGRKVDDFAARQVRIEGDINKAHLRRFVATAGKPFIPGSSLKGAIRTATLVDWLLNRKDGEPELGRIR